MSLAGPLMSLAAALIGGAAAAITSWAAIRVCVARIEQRLSDHIVESDRRITSVEALLGFEGRAAAFLRRDEAEIHIKAGDEFKLMIQDRLEELRQGQLGLAKGIAELRSTSTN